MMINTRLKKKIQEGITNLSSMGQIPKDEVTLNLDVLYDSILSEVCSVVPIESPRQVISCLKLIHDSEDKKLVEVDDIQKDAYKLVLMNGVGAVPMDDYGYPTKEVTCSVIPDKDNNFVLNYSNVIPGTVVIADDYVDDNGLIVHKETKDELGAIDYIKGAITFTGNLPASATMTYSYDIYNLDYQRNFAKFVKSYVEVFADLYALDIDSALVLNDMKSLNLKENIENILPQVLTQQIDGYILSKYFKQAEQQILGTFDSTIVPPSVYADLGTFISNKTNEFVKETGVMPNVILCDAKGYSILSSSVKFQPLTKEDENKTSGTPKFVGYFNNFKVILTNIINSEVNIVLTYKGDSDAQAAGVYAPLIPVTLRNVNGSEGGGMIITTNAYSMGGFAMINPDLVKGIKIK